MGVIKKTPLGYELKPFKSTLKGSKVSHKKASYF